MSASRRLKAAYRRREVPDLECNRPEASERNKGVKRRHSTRVWNEIAQCAQRRASLLHGAPQPGVINKWPHEQSKAQLIEGQPCQDLCDELHGRLDSENPVPALIGAGVVGEEMEHAAVDDEDNPGNAAPNAPRYDQRA